MNYKDFKDSLIGLLELGKSYYDKKSGVNFDFLNQSPTTGHPHLKIFSEEHFRNPFYPVETEKVSDTSNYRSNFNICDIGNIVDENTKNNVIFLTGQLPSNTNLNWSTDPYANTTITKKL